MGCGSLMPNRELACFSAPYHGIDFPLCTGDFPLRTGVGTLCTGVGTLTRSTSRYAQPTSRQHGASARAGTPSHIPPSLSRPPRLLSTPVPPFLSPSSATPLPAPPPTAVLSAHRPSPGVPAMRIQFQRDFGSFGRKGQWAD